MSYFYSHGYKVKLARLAVLKDLKQHFKEYRRTYSEEAIRQNGREDGAANIPRVDAESLSPYEQELLHSNARIASLVASNYKGPLELLDAKIRAEREFVERRHRNALERAESIYQTEREAAEDSHGLKDAHQELEWSEKHYQALHDKHGRAPVQYIPHWLYVVFALLIFLGEIPLNALVFRIFGENEIMTWVMAFVIGLSVPVIAHFVGVKLREHPQGLHWPNLIKATGATALVILAMHGISVLRTLYLGENSEDLGLSAAMVEGTSLFFWLNIAVYCAAVIVAYMAHDSVPGFERAEKDVARARREVARRETRRVRLLKACAVARTKALDKANEGLRDGMSIVRMLQGTYDQLLKEGQEQESRCLDALRLDIQKYRRENLRARPDQSTPKSFETEASFPLELAQLGEKLSNEEHNESK